MVGNVLEDRLFAALLVVAGMLFPDMARAETGQLSDSLVNTRDCLVTLPIFINYFCYSLAMMFACWAAYRWEHNARRKIPIKPVRFGLVVFAALLFASVPSILDLIRDYYSRNP